MAFRIIRDDISKVKADAIVNSANPEPVYGGGTDSAIYEAAGAKELLAERKKIGDIAPGFAVKTKAYELDAKIILHTVGPVWTGGDAGEFETLRRCYENCLELAEEYKCKSIAFPLISTGVYGFPKDEALSIAVGVFDRYLKDHDMDIILVVFDRESFRISASTISDIDAYISDNYADEKSVHEYLTGSAYHSMAIASTLIAPQSPGSYKEKARELFAAKSAVEDTAVFEAAPQPSKKRSLEDVLGRAGETFQESLFRLMDEKGLKPSQVYKGANLTKQTFSKIKKDREYHPSRETAYALALALHLNLDETVDFIGKAGYAFSNSSKLDLIVKYYIEDGFYNIVKINCTLFEYDQQLLGNA